MTARLQNSAFTQQSGTFTTGGVRPGSRWCVVDGTLVETPESTSAGGSVPGGSSYWARVAGARRRRGIRGPVAKSASARNPPLRFD